MYAEVWEKFGAFFRNRRADFEFWTRRIQYKVYEMSIVSACIFGFRIQMGATVP